MDSRLLVDGVLDELFDAVLVEKTNELTNLFAVLECHHSGNRVYLYTQETNTR